MNDKLLSMLGLCKRAGKLTVGNDPVIQAADRGEALIVLTASDISHNTEKKLHSALERNKKVRHIIVDRTKEQMSIAIGKTCAVLAVTDRGFADTLEKLIKLESKQEEIPYEDKI